MTTYRIGPDVAWHAGDDDAADSAGAGTGTGISIDGDGNGDGGPVRAPARVAVLDLADAAAVPFVLEGSASAIWTAIADHGDGGPEKIVEAVAARFGLEPAEVESDVRAFLDELVGRDLIDAREDPL